MPLMEVASRPGAPKVQIIVLPTPEERFRHHQIVQHGLRGDDNRQPRYVKGAPKCATCGEFYSRERATATIDHPHVCIVCKQTDDHYFPARQSRDALHGHLLSAGSIGGRDDCSRGYRARN